MAAHRHHGVGPICRVLSTEEHQIADETWQPLTSARHPFYVAKTTLNGPGNLTFAEGTIDPFAALQEARSSGAVPLC